MSAGTCRVRVHESSRDVGGHACGRPISPEDPDGKVCALHLGARRKREALEDGTARQQAEDDARKATAQAACDRLREVGIYAEPTWQVNFLGKRASRLGGAHTGGVSITAASVPKLLARLGVDRAAVKHAPLCMGEGRPTCTCGASGQRT